MTLSTEIGSDCGAGIVRCVAEEGTPIVSGAIELDARVRRLHGTLAAALVPHNAPELQLAHAWLDNWRGVGQVAEGMHCAGWDLQLTEYGDGNWRDVLCHGAGARPRPHCLSTSQ